VEIAVLFLAICHVAARLVVAGAQSTRSSFPPPPMHRLILIAWLVAPIVALGCGESPAPAGTLEIIINTPPFPTTVPNYRSRLLAFDHSTGQVVFDRSMAGLIQDASLSDANEAVYSLTEIGSPIFNPNYSLQVQPLDQSAPSAAIAGAGWLDGLAITDQRIVWRSAGGIHVVNRNDGSQQNIGGSNASNLQMAGSAIAWQAFNITGYTVHYTNLDTGSSFPYYFYERPIQSVALPRRGPTVVPPTTLIAAAAGRLYRDSGFGISGGSQIDVQTATGLPLNVTSPMTNGGHIIFRGATPMREDGTSLESGLYLLEGGAPQLLVSSEQLGGNPGTYSISSNAVAWQEQLGANLGTIRVRDLATGNTQTLPDFGTGLQLWDVNDRYVLFSVSVPVPESSMSSLVAMAAFSAAGVRRRSTA